MMQKILFSILIAIICLYGLFGTLAYIDQPAWAAPAMQQTTPQPISTTSYIRTDSSPFQSGPIWRSAGVRNAQVVAWGDVDGDGDLDLAVGNEPSGSGMGNDEIYLNISGTLRADPSWRSEVGAYTSSMAWGDMDGDGDLDLAVGRGASVTGGVPGKNVVYRNDGMNAQGLPLLSIAWQAEEVENTLSVAWGDVDRDGDLDLAVGNSPGRNRVYENTGINNQQELLLDTVWESDNEDPTNSIALVDIDQNGFLDFFAGNEELSRLYLNSDGILDTAAAWTSESEESDGALSVSFGDMDGDGYPDLAAGNWHTSTKVYLNQQGALETSPTVTLDDVRSWNVTWGDMDGDGDFDLLTAPANRIYLNDGKTISTSTAYQFGQGDSTRFTAVGDINGDGDLDIAAGNSNDFVKVHINNNQVFRVSPITPISESEMNSSIAWGDVDSDGDLDLAIGRYTFTDFDGDEKCWRVNSAVYLNHGLDETGALSTTVGWMPDLCTKMDDPYGWSSVSWVDVDEDGDLDLAAGGESVFDENELCWRENLTVYRNAGLDDNDQLKMSVLWRSDACFPFETRFEDNVRSLAWGNVYNDSDILDNNSDMDLALVRSSVISGTDCIRNGVQVYKNNGISNSGDLQLIPRWTPTNCLQSPSSIAWGDVDDDGDLDLAIGNEVGADEIYMNTGGELETIPSWASIYSDTTTSVAWGDINGDGRLDLAVGNSVGPNRIFFNTASGLETFARWNSEDADHTEKVHLYDIDLDGDLDFIAGNGLDPSIVYLNNGGHLSTSTEMVWKLGNEPIGQFDLGDADGDGDPDLAVAGDQSSVYLSTNLAELQHPHGIYAAIVNSPYQPSLLPQNDTSSVSKPPTARGLPEVVETSATGDKIIVPIQYALFHPASQPVREVRGYYSLNGGGKWQPATTNITESALLATNPYPTITLSNMHVFNWDISNSNFFGQISNVVFRIEALPYLGPVTGSVAGPYQRPLVAAQTAPFRAEGLQIRSVMSTGTSYVPAANTIVYRLPVSQTRGAQPFRGTSEPFHTDGQGYLQGRGQFANKDRFIALHPRPLSSTIPYTDSTKLFFTNAIPITTGMRAYTVAQSSAHTLTVTSANPLLLFDLDVSLEWDARQDTRYLSDLQFDLQRTSEHLYDWTNGQVALGNIRIFQDKQHWQDAHVRIYATNQFRPRAARGGIVSQEYTETFILTGTSGLAESSVITFYQGQVHMGATWDRFGRAGDSLSEDWSRVLAHELGHYLLFLEDNYLGLNPQGLLVPNGTCKGAMADPYIDSQSEFHPVEGWEQSCAQTLSAQTTGMSDWETIEYFYPPLHAPPAGELITQVLPGPSVLPLAVTRPQIQPLAAPTDTLDVPIFYMVDSSNGRYVGSRDARAFLFQPGRLVDLGRPTQDRVLARGAAPGDRLCVFDFRQEQMGCQLVKAGVAQIKLLEQKAWPPEITISPQSTQTLEIQVSTSALPLITDSVSATLYPLHAQYITETVETTLTWSATDSTASHQTFIGVLEAPTVTNDATEVPVSILEGLIHVQARQQTAGNQISPPLDTVIDYFIGGNPGFVKSGPGRVLAGGIGFVKSGPGRVVAYGPALSADGQILLSGGSYTDLEEDQFVTLQNAPVISDPPAGRTVIGRAYHFTAPAKVFSSTLPITETGETASMLEPTNTMSSTKIPASITFNYFGVDVPLDTEQWLQIYYQADGAELWEPLVTSRFPEHNLASARAIGSGTYALMHSVEIPLHEGWNLIGYPVVVSQIVTNALASIEGAYTYAFGHDQSQRSWTVYPHEATDEFDALDVFEFGKGYWIHATEPITLYLNGDTQNGNSAQSSSIPSGAVDFPPPITHAVLYGDINAAQPITLDAGLAFTVTFTSTDEKSCGSAQGRTRGHSSGVIKYAVLVPPSCQSVENVEIHLTMPDGAVCTGQLAARSALTDDQLHEPQNVHLNTCR